MMARKRSLTRTQDCGKAEAKIRLDDARQQLAYGFGRMGAQKHGVAIRQAKALVEFAELTLQR